MKSPPTDHKIPLYGVDSMLFVYHFEENEEFGLTAGKVFHGAEHGFHRLVTSVVSMMEVLVVPKRSGMEDLTQRYREIFESFPNLTVLPVDTAVVEIASGLRAKHNLRTPDALHVATAIHGGANAFLSNDVELKKKVTEIPVWPLSDLHADHGVPRCRQHETSAT